MSHHGCTLGLLIRSPRSGGSLSSTEIEPSGIVSATEARLAAYQAFDPDMDFRKLVAEAQPGFFARGFRLITKDELIGVPHVVTRVTYRPGYMDPQTKRPGDYASCEAVVADTEVLEAIPIRSQLPSPLTVFGNEPVIYNDGSTGIRRALTQLFHDHGIIDVGPEHKDENRFDRPYQQWKDGGDLAEMGIEADFHGNKFRYVATRGLRVSEYENEYGPGRTFYFG